MDNYFKSEIEALESRLTYMHERYAKYREVYSQVKVGVKIEDMVTGEIMCVDRLVEGDSCCFIATSLNDSKLTKGYSYLTANWKFA